MKNIHRNKIVAISFLIIIGGFTSLTVGKIGIKATSKIIEKLTVVEAVEVNSNDEESKDKTLEDKDDVVQVSLSDKLKELVGKIENVYNDNIFKKNMFIEINGYSQRLLGKKVIDDVEEGRTVIKDSNDYLHFNLTEEPIDISYQAESIAKLNEFCSNGNMKFMYVQAPFKVTEEKGQLPIGINDYSNYISDNLLKELERKNITYLDLRDSMIEDSLNYEDVFFKTDHHWTIESGFWAYTKIINELTSKYGLKFDDMYTNIENYDINLIEKSFVGSQGTRVGKYYTDIDDVKLYIPKFKTDFIYSLFDQEGNVVKKREGDFCNSLINKENMENKDLYTSKYESFLETNNETHIINNNVDNDTKVLFIKDSFARPVAGYMSLNFKETRLLDLRTYEGNTYEYIKEYNPDIVIMLYNPSVIKDEDMFNFEN